MDIYWAIKNKHGELVGPVEDYHNTGEAPLLFDDEDEAKAHCWALNGERPVRVTITEVE